MAFVLAKSHGRPYSSYVPDPLSRSRAQFADVAERFAQIDDELKRLANEHDFDDGLANANSSAELVGDGLASMRGERPALRAAVLALAGKQQWAMRDLIECNRLATGAPAGALRTRPVWMDGGHPADSWYVAAPPNLLQGKLRELCRLADERTLPASLRACITLLMLLQLHPFEDGNGRTARAAYAALILRELGPAGRAMAALSKLWLFRGLHLHRTSLHLRDSGDWQPYLELCLEALGQG